MKHRKYTAVRWLAALLAACLLLAALPFGALAADADYELYYVAGGFIRVNRYTGALNMGVNMSGDLVIPESIEGVQVTSIDDGAFQGERGENLTSVTIPSTVTSIGDSAFYGCRGLTSLTVPGSVKSIGNNAFTYCDSLKTVTLEEGVETLGTGVFRYCYGLESVTLPSTLAAIPDQTFGSCLALKNVTIASGPRSLGDSAFAGCINLTSITLPNSITAIGNNCFNGCTALTTVRLPNGITSIPMGMFDGCSSVNRVVVPEGVERINSLAFRNCTSLTQIALPDSVTSFPANAFSGASDDLTFYVHAGSFSQAFAAANNINFVLRDLPENTDDNNNGSGNYAETPFTDDKSHWAKSYIEWAYAMGYVSGTTATTFSPNSSLSRGMLVTILYNIEGKPSTGTASFTDLTLNYYKAPIAWAEANNIVSGVGNGKFAPGQSITREQLAAILYRYAQYKGKSTSQVGDMTQFRDTAQISRYAGTAVSWAVGAGIISGKGNGTLDPRGSATRAEAVVMLQKFASLG